MLQQLMTGIDSLSRVGFGPSFTAATRQRGWDHADRPHGVFAAHGSDPAPRVRAVRRALPQPAPPADVHLLRPAPLSGLRPTDVPRESPRHRDMLAGPPGEAVPVSYT